MIYLLLYIMQKGLVIKSTGSWYKVKGEDEKFYDCRIKGKFRIKGIKTTNPIAVGDEVEFSGKEEEFVINNILPRKNYIIRKSVNLSKQSQIIASNLDQALLIVTLASPPTSTGFIDRFLVTAEAYQIPVTIVFNKIDIYTEQEREKLEYLIGTYFGIGYNCIEVSATEDINTNKVKSLLKNKTTLLSGHSGVGKSTLVNAIDPNLDLRTQEVSEYHSKGQHTTTFAELFELDFGGNIIDTPGIKGLGIIDIEREELSHYFVEIKELSQDCKFNNCMHLKEPKCAVKNALETGELSEERYKSYISILEELNSDSNFRVDIYK